MDVPVEETAASQQWQLIYDTLASHKQAGICPLRCLREIYPENMACLVEAGVILVRSTLPVKGLYYLIPRDPCVK
jgi:hypothetical protein